MRMTRKKLVVRTGAAALWVGPARRSSRIGWARSTSRPGSIARSSRSPVPRPSPCFVRGATTTISRALLVELRLVDANVRRSASCSSRTSSSSCQRPAINTDPRMVVPPRTHSRGSGARRVVVAEGPGHRRDTEASRSPRACARSRRGRPRFVDLNHAPLVRTPLGTRYTGCASSGCRASCASRPDRLDAEAQDAPLGRGHAVDEELFRRDARCLRLAEERPALRGHPGVDPRHQRDRPAATWRSSTGSSAWRATARSWATRASGVLIVGDPRRRRHGRAPDGHGPGEGRAT